jgi:hypothetical protein
MSTVVLFVVMFLHDGRAVTVVRQAPSLEVCEAARPDVMNAALQKPEVDGVSVQCLAIKAEPTPKA